MSDLKAEPARFIVEIALTRPTYPVDRSLHERMARVAEALAAEVSRIDDIKVTRDQKPFSGADDAWPVPFTRMHLPHPYDWVLMIEGGLQVLLAAASLVMNWYRTKKRNGRKEPVDVTLRFWVRRRHIELNLDDVELTLRELEVLVEEESTTAQR